MMSILFFVLGGMIMVGGLLVAFFFITTHGSLLFLNLFPSAVLASSRHVYWIYRSSFLVWLTDRKQIVSAVLLFQYDTLVRALLNQLEGFRFKQGEILQIGCVSGDLTEKLARRHQHHHITILDITCAGIQHTLKKLDRAHIYTPRFLLGDAGCLPFKNESVDSALSFFLFHELPTRKKQFALQESLRVIRSGGIFLFAEFHRPNTLLLRMLGHVIFGLFEPYAKEMWAWNPTYALDPTKFVVERMLYAHGYFQVVCIKKL